MKLKIMKFGAVWCGPCKALDPVWNKIKEDMGDDVDFAEVDIDNDPTTAQQYSVSSIPTILILDNGKVVDTLVGLHKESLIRDAIDAHR